jgi:acetylornithine deacetylase/succinyl-diaminopimelate desuccinylase-like protein
VAEARAVPDPVALLRQLLRFDTSNPPGSERACIEFIAAELAEAGLRPRLLSVDPERPNLIARVAGRGEAPPLLLYGHVDVVPAVGSEWTHPPFSAKVADGSIWGRGALDMKGGVALVVAAVARLAASEPPPGDVVLALTSDEEAGSRTGMRFLVEQHPEQLAGIRHAFSEVGGMTMWIGERRVTPVQIAEKQRCLIRATVRGRGGHAATAVHATASGSLGKLLVLLDTKPLPYRVTPAAEAVVQALAAELGGEFRAPLLGLLSGGDLEPRLRALGDLGASLEPLLRDTATVTGMGGEIAGNVVPSKLHADLDGRVLPGGSPEGLLAALEDLAPGLADYEIVDQEPAVESQPDFSQLPLLAAAIREHYPDAPLVPWMLAGYTDARYVSRLGIQTYGFLPLRLPREITPALMHAADERVPLAAIEPGLDCLLGAVRRYRG